jgi:glycosyltransferase involved in cell wall biosynthesis
MKILHIITRLDKGGSAETVVYICEYFNKKEGYEIVLVYGGETKVNLSCKNYYIKELKRKISLVNDIIAFLKIYKIIKKEKPDIIHTHSSKAGIIGRLAAWLVRKINYKLKFFRIIHTPHGHIFYGYYGKLKTLLFLFLERLTAKITDKLVALTEGEKNESLSFGVGKEQQWVIIPCGIDYNLELKVSNKLRDLSRNLRDSELKEKLGISKNSIVVGTVARLEPIKGIRYLVDAAKIILSLPSSYLLPSIYFIIVGDGSERKFLEEKVEKLGLKDKFIFTGMRDDVAELMSIMDIYVQPSINEGMGKTIVLAELLGKPVVATNVQGIPSVVINNETGILVPPKDPQKLAEAIVKLINDKDLRIKMGENAKKWVYKIVDEYPQFSQQRMLFLLENLYKMLVHIY